MEKTNKSVHGIINSYFRKTMLFFSLKTFCRLFGIKVYFSPDNVPGPNRKRSASAFWLVGIKTPDWSVGWNSPPTIYAATIPVPDRQILKFHQLIHSLQETTTIWCNGSLYSFFTEILISRHSRIVPIPIKILCWLTSNSNSTWIKTITYKTNKQTNKNMCMLRACVMYTPCRQGEGSLLT